MDVLQIAKKLEGGSALQKKTTFLGGLQTKPQVITGCLRMQLQSVDNFDRKARYALEAVPKILSESPSKSGLKK